MYETKKFGWLPDPLDHRDFTVRDEFVTNLLNRVLPNTSRGIRAPNAATSPAGPLVVDLRPWCSPIENQGAVGSCTANAVVGAFEYFQRRTGAESVDASRLFLYRSTRRFLGWDGKGDTGAFIRSTIKALRLFGTPPEAYWPYDEASFDKEPEAFHYAFAQNFRAIRYFRLEENVDLLKSALDAGLPFAFGFTCFRSLLGEEVERTGVIPFPRNNDSVIGGHAVLAVGYTDSHLLIRNSWGSGWGDNGYGYLPWDYFNARRSLATDCWALVDASWVPEDEADADVERRNVYVSNRDRMTASTEIRSTEPGNRYAPLISIERGRDVLQEVPLRLTGKGLAVAGEGAQIVMPESDGPVDLTIGSVKLTKSFDFSLFGKATNELYLTAIAWDLSGAPPVLFPIAATPEQFKGMYYRMQEGEKIEFLRDGLPIWSSRKVVGTLFVRILVLENDDDVRRVGERLEGCRRALGQSQLVGALAALAAGATAGTIAAVGAAATALMGTVAQVLTEDGDDVVALFDGSYGADRFVEETKEAYSQGGATIEIRTRPREVRPVAAPADMPRREPRRSAREMMLDRP